MYNNDENDQTLIMLNYQEFVDSMSNETKSSVLKRDEFNVKNNKEKAIFGQLGG